MLCLAHLQPSRDVSKPELVRLRRRARMLNISLRLPKLSRPFRSLISKLYKQMICLRIGNTEAADTTHVPRARLLLVAQPV